MTNMRVVAGGVVGVVIGIVIGIVIGVQPLAAQEPDLSRYRDYMLGSDAASVLAISRARADSVKTLHSRPALIQEIEWRAPYVSPGAEGADPVRDIVFSFHDDQLYRVTVTYDRDRVEGLTDDDVIESISAAYGVPLLRHLAATHGAPPADVRAATAVLARWENAAATVDLTRDVYPLQFRLTLTSKAVGPNARGAIAEARRLDVQEAPQRELDKRTKDIADARVAKAKARVVNKAAFKP